MYDYLFVGLPHRDGRAIVYREHGQVYARVLGKLLGLTTEMASCFEYPSPPLWVTRLTPYVRDTRVAYYDLAEFDTDSISHTPLAAVYLLSCFTSTFHRAVVFAQMMKARDRDCKVVLGGSHVVGSAVDDAVALGLFDVVVRGEGEAYMECAESFRDRVYDAAPVSLDLLPMPDYSLIRDRERFIDVTVMTSRGCPYGCIYCLEGERPYRVKSIDRVVAEVEDALAEFPRANFVRFNDSSFTARFDIVELCAELTVLEGMCQTRANIMSDNVLSALMGANIRTINVGCETGSAQLLHRLGKRIDKEMIVSSLRRAKEKGFVVNTYWMVGVPGEKPETVRETADFIRYLFDRGLTDLAEMSICVPYPGTPLHRDPRDIEIEHDVLYHRYRENDLSCTRTREMSADEIYDAWRQTARVITDRMATRL